MYCTNCGANMPEGTKFCTSCGAPLQSELPARRAAGLTCPTCGAQMPAGTKFCTQCGTSLGVSRVAGQPKPQPMAGSSPYVAASNTVPANGPTAKPSVPPALDDAALRAFFADLFDESAERKKTKDDAAFGAFFPLADLLGEPAERKKTKAESFCAGLSTVCGFLWIMLIVLIIVIFISEPGDMISSFQNGQPPDYIVLFSLLFSPVVCAGLMYKAERNKQYFKEDYLGTFLRGAVCASCLFALVLVYGLISMAMHTLR